MRALSLPGCGCRGAFQFAVLARLEAAGERFDVAAGASSGSIAAAAYVAGKCSLGPEIYRSLAGTPVFSARWLASERSPFGMTRIVGDALREHLPEALIHRSEVELLVSTTTVPGLLHQLVWKDGRAVIHSSRERRDIHSLLLASCTFPPFYARVPRLDGRFHFDGGATDNNLIGALAERGARSITVITPHPDGAVYHGLFRPLEKPRADGLTLRVIAPARRLSIRSFDFDPQRLAEALEMEHVEHWFEPVARPS